MPFKELYFQSQPLMIGIGGYIAVLLVLTLPFSTALTLVFSAALLLLWISSAQFKSLPIFIKQNPLALLALLLFFYLAVGITYTTASPENAFSTLSKYRELLLLIVLPPFFQSEFTRRWAWNAFIIASIVTILGSYAIYFGLIDYMQPMDPSIKNRITHSLLVAFFAFFCAHKSLQTDKYSPFYMALLVLCIHNLFFLVSGRTGQLIFLLLMMLFYIQRFSIKKAALLITATVALLLVFIACSDRANRINEGFSQTQNYLHSESGETNTSEGQRLTFWKHSLTLISENPWLGHGTGSYPTEYSRVAAKADIASNNPHNEYLMITIQTGIVGLLLFLAFLFSLYQCSLKLADEYKWLAQGILVALAINSLFNSTILDFTEGHWFTTMIALCFATLPTHTKPCSV
ncbi:O-antigen ligase family protein [Methylobacter sp. YRD-M1]|uniref:O-antigen ligase family protein n=1 Tax=Methylobacter sp. YRD-M1 TaxID=2911520 RepID=UPI00227A4D3B|nr:O-antigen ligase family protein [Methylobacter sp. YRD-M1]WAK01994.1 O-antigen ligase family protein [Methylobacter sp. YRD-M1]